MRNGGQFHHANSCLIMDLVAGFILMNCYLIINAVKVITHHADVVLFYFAYHSI